MQPCFILLLFAIVATATGQGWKRKGVVTVQAPAGTYHGKLRTQTLRSRGEEKINKFLGIQYGEAPVGELRFRPPQPMKDHKKEQKAFEFGASCLQPRNVQTEYLGSFLTEFMRKLTFSEDCLNLNIYSSGEIDPENPKPVMVFLHGGGYAIGSANVPFHDAEFLANQGDLVVVTLNYRLGPMGFMATEDGAAAGNFGLLDQTLALKWIQRNIKAFGGDPDNVLLSGNGAGAMSVTIHVMSPLSKGLFHKAATQSGNHGGRLTAVMPYLMEIQSMKLAAKLGCHNIDFEQMLACLRKIPSEAFVSAQEAEEFLFVPVIDGYVLPDDQAIMIEKGQFPKIPFFMGSTSQDGSVALRLFKRPFYDGLAENQVSMAVEYIALLCGYMAKIREVRDAILDEYFPGDRSNKFGNLEGALRMFSDFMFIAPEEHFLMNEVKYDGTAFQYYHTARPTFKKQNDKIQLGADLGDDVLFMFGLFLKGGLLEGLGTEKEQTLSLSIMHAWASFAHTGQPSFLDEEGNEHKVPKYNQMNQPYVEFNYHMSSKSVKNDLKPGVDEFWNSAVPAIGRDDD